jgi:hypothetical protein
MESALSGSGATLYDHRINQYLWSDVMDDFKTNACKDVTASVSRDFEPIRIERQLLARAFDLLCETQSHATAVNCNENPRVQVQPTTSNVGQRRIA